MRCCDATKEVIRRRRGRSRRFAVAVVMKMVLASEKEGMVCCSREDELSWRTAAAKIFKIIKGDRAWGKISLSV